MIETFVVVCVSDFDSTTVDVGKWGGGPVGDGTVGVFGDDLEDT